MTAIISAIDNSTQKQFGDNGAIEYGWSNSLKEKVLQFSGQLVRSDETRIEEIAQTLTKLLSRLSNKNCSMEISERKELLVILYKLIGQTRDIVSGKGEYALAYMQIYVWYGFFPALSTFALQKFVRFDNDEHPYGSIKDIKYFCNYVLKKSDCKTHPLIEYAFNLMIELISNDIESEKKLLSGKWVPREGSAKFGWQFNILAEMFFQEYIVTAKNEDQKKRASTKCKMDFRKISSSLNKKLDTVQIKQCANRWAEINHSTTTSITNSRQKKAFLNINNKGQQRTQLDDRIKCAENYKERIEKAISGEGPQIKGKRVGMDDFGKEALKLIGQCIDSKLEKDILNSQWKDNSEQTGALDNMIAVVDVSGSMTAAGAIYPAIALGIRVAEKSKLGKRIITFSEKPMWHNLENKDTFVDCVENLMKAQWGMNTNFLAMFDMILDAIIEKKLKPIEAKGFVLAIFSDMQFDSARGGDMDTIYEIMLKKYSDAGIRLWSEPFELPHLLFWNLTPTNGFPVLSTFKNTSFISGYSPSQLNLFCEKGIDFLSDINPWVMLKESLKNPRYDCLETEILGQLDEL
jgi:hypothetical protein